MKKLILFVLSLSIISCATFNPGTLQYRSAVTTPGSKNVDSVYVFVKQYNYSEAKLVFDTDFRYFNFEPIYISVFNRSYTPVIVDPLNVENHTNIDEVTEKTERSPFAYFVGWSIPWGINMLVGLPLYYGIAWPVFGIVAMTKTKNANRKREEYYKNVCLKHTELQNGQEIDGVVFIKNDSTKTIKLHLIRKDSTKIDFEFDNKNEMPTN